MSKPGAVGQVTKDEIVPCRLAHKGHDVAEEPGRKHPTIGQPKHRRVLG